jgi:hypothetical protein
MRLGPMLCAASLCWLGAAALRAAEDGQDPPAPAQRNQTLDEAVGLSQDSAGKSEALNAALLQALQKAGPDSGVDPTLMKSLKQALNPAEPGASAATASPSDQAEPAAQKEGPREAMGIPDARINFRTVVESKLAAESAKGFWSYQDPAGGRTWALAYRKVDESSLIERGSNLFSGCVLFKRKDPPAKVDLDFTVDFSGTHWEVTGVKVHSVVLQKRSR